MYFPARNRIISGLSRGVIVVEAARRSGTLITVDTANEQGRDVFAVPGNITNNLSSGTNELIKNGAHVATEYSDILQVLGIENQTKAPKKAPIKLAIDEKLVYDYLNLEPIAYDQLLELTMLDAGVLHMALIMLETKGAAKKLPGNRFIRN
jgi:DNA processing protein